MYFRILAIITLFFITGCSGNSVNTTIQKQNHTNLVKHNINIETFSGSNIFIYSQDNTELLYETQTNSSGGFVIDTQVMDQKIQTRNVTDKLVWVVVTGGIYREYSFGEGERFNKKILFLLSYEDLKKENGYDFSIINNVISEMVALSSDDLTKRYNYIKDTISEAEKVGEKIKATHDGYVSSWDDYGSLWDYYTRVYLRISTTKEWYSATSSTELRAYSFIENIYPIRIEETNSGIILHKYLEKNTIYYGTGEQVIDMDILPNRYVDGQVLIVNPNEPIFFHECNGGKDSSICIGITKQVYPFKDLEPTGGYVIFTENGESRPITSEQIDALEESGQIQQMR